MERPMDHDEPEPKPEERSLNVMQAVVACTFTILAIAGIVYAIHHLITS